MSFKNPLFQYCPKCAHSLVVNQFDGVDRSVCEKAGCGFVLWDNPVPVVAGLVEYQGSILLARNALWPKGLFSFITGYLERNESPEQAIIRETQEELGLTAEVSRFIGHYPFNKKNQLIIAFALQALGEVDLGDEIVETLLVPRATIGEHDFGPLTLSAKIVADWVK